MGNDKGKRQDRCGFWITSPNGERDFIETVASDPLEDIKQKLLDWLFTLIILCIWFFGKFFRGREVNN